MALSLLLQLAAVAPLGHHVEGILCPKGNLGKHWKEPLFIFGLVLFPDFVPTNVNLFGNAWCQAQRWRHAEESTVLLKDYSDLRVLKESSSKQCWVSCGNFAELAVTVPLLGQTWGSCCLSLEHCSQQTQHHAAQFSAAAAPLTPAFLRIGTCFQEKALEKKKKAERATSVQHGDETAQGASSQSRTSVRVPDLTVLPSLYFS